MAIELRGERFWLETILVISNQTRAARSFEFEITRMCSPLRLTSTHIEFSENVACVQFKRLLFLAI